MLYQMPYGTQEANANLLDEISEKDYEAEKENPKKVLRSGNQKALVKKKKAQKRRAEKKPPTRRPIQYSFDENALKPEKVLEPQKENESASFSEQCSIRRQGFNQKKPEPKENMEPPENPGPGHLEGEEDIPPDYLRLLQKRIEANKIYPLSSKRLGEEGKVTVKFTLDKKGMLLGPVEIISPCHWARLNEAAQKIIKRSLPFPALPAQTKKDRFTFTMDIVFDLVSS